MKLMSKILVALALLAPAQAPAADTGIIGPGQRLIRKSIASCSNPRTGYFCDFIDSDDSFPKYQDSSGNQRTYLMDFGAQSVAGVKTFSNTPLFTDSIEIEDDDGGTNKVKVAVSNSIGANWTLRLPPNDGTNLQVLKTDGNGNTTWEDDEDGSGSIFTPNTTVTLTTSDTSWTVPAGLLGNEVEYFLYGAGGGGGQSTGNLFGGGGGAGCSYRWGRMRVSPGQKINVFIPAGGAAGTGTSGGTAGQPALFGGIMAKGGRGGDGSSAAAANGWNSGGATGALSPQAFIAPTITSTGGFEADSTFHPGGTGGGYPAVGCAGGGGGAMGAGGNTTCPSPGTGGIGGEGFDYTNPVTTTTLSYCGGGGGGGYLGNGGAGTDGGGNGATPGACSAGVRGGGGGGGDGGASPAAACAGGPGGLVLSWKE